MPKPLKQPKIILQLEFVEAIDVLLIWMDSQKLSRKVQNRILTAMSIPDCLSRLQILPAPIWVRELIISLARASHGLTVEEKVQFIKTLNKKGFAGMTRR